METCGRSEDDVGSRADHDGHSESSLLGACAQVNVERGHARCAAASCCSIDAAVADDRVEVPAGIRRVEAVERDALPHRGEIRGVNVYAAPCCDRQSRRRLSRDVGGGEDIHAHHGVAGGPARGTIGNSEGGRSVV